MSLMKTDTVQATTIEQVLISGDLSRLTAEQRNIYYKSVCDSLGLNPLTRPFDYITLNGKLTLYARKDCTDQLRKLQGVSIRIVSRESADGVIVVTAQATDKHGRIDESTGAVSVQGLRGEALANATMKAETKAKRRVTLSICGLGFTDESEVESIPHARIETAPRAADNIVASRPALPDPTPAARRSDPTPLPVVEAPVVALPPVPTSVPDEGEWECFISAIEEHKGKSGPVWRITDTDGNVFAVLDALVVEDLATIRNDGRLARCEVQKRGQRHVILSVQGVAQ